MKSHRVADLRFADWEAKEICAFAICGLIITNLRICGLAYHRNFQICDCGMSLRICGFAICGPSTKFACPPSLSNVGVVKLILGCKEL
jgi:hypothetical protein